MDFRILGPLEVAENGRMLEIGRGKQRALLGVLLLRPNEVVAQDRLVDDLWGESPPPTAPTALHGYVSGLRKLLGADRVETRVPGYALRLHRAELDAHRFEERLAEGRHDDALALWRGPALADFAYEPFAQAEIVRLEELRLVALEGRIDGELAEGRHAGVVGELEALVREHPLRERFYGQLMLALYRSERQAEALAVYASARSTLVEELGLEPGERLRTLQRQILEQDSALDDARGTTPEREEATSVPPLRRVRKTVSILFCDLADSTTLSEALDAEVVDEILGRSYESAASVIQRHGGTVAKYAGNAVMGVFGLPRVHEDDALRALRAASELRDALGIRVGVNTGEVIAGGEALASGDAANGAARLQQEAAPGQVVLGEATLRLARDAIRAEPVGLGVKGKTQPVLAWRLDELIPDAPPFERRLDAPLVGRERALSTLRSAFDEVVADQAPHLLTLVGEAGIGKTRLAIEFAAAVGADARVLVGRCLSYGEGITYWPIAEIARQLGDVDQEVRRLLGSASDAAAISAALAGVVGQGHSTAGRDEIFRALLRLLEALARERPLVLVFEDIHWAEPTLLELIEQLAEIARESPIFILCLARPEVFEDRPSWGAGKPRASSLLLEPLSDTESDELIDVLRGPAPLPADARRKIADATEGNPLFVEQMLASLRLNEATDLELAVPPTIRALLNARIERLGPGERAVAEVAAVVGKEFWGKAVERLLPEDAREFVPRHLDSLVRKELVRPTSSPFVSEDAYRFRHMLILDAVYRSIPKRARTTLHEQFADWLAGLEQGANPYDEIVGYHLEQAVVLRRELGDTSEATDRLAGRAVDSLHRAGRRALDRGDLSAARSLLSRAVELLTEAEPRPVLLDHLSAVLINRGEMVEAGELLARAIDEAGRIGDRAVEAGAKLRRARLRMRTDPTFGAVDLELVANEVITLSESFGDDRMLARAWETLGWAYQHRSRSAEAERAFRRALECFRRLDVSDQDELYAGNVAFVIAGAVASGPRTVSEAVAECRTLSAGLDLLGQARLATVEGELIAMCGKFDEARTLFAAGVEQFEVAGWPAEVARARRAWGNLDALAGDLPAAEARLREAHAYYETSSESYVRSGVAAELSEVCLRQGRENDAVEWMRLAARLADDDDVYVHVQVDALRGRIAARRKRSADALRLSQRAVTLALETENPELRARARESRAAVLEMLGRDDDAVLELREALAEYERKGHTVGAEGVKAALARVKRR